MPPSITYWQRIEPNSRAHDLRRGLAAQIRDPAWLLARQWQLGEFQGEDAGSAAYIELVTKVATIRAWEAGGKTLSFANSPLENQAAAETPTTDLALRVEIGQTFEMLLELFGAAAEVQHFRQAYPLSLNWQDALPLFTTTETTASDLDAGKLSDKLPAAFSVQEIDLSLEIAFWTKVAGSEWVITDLESGRNFAIIADRDAAVGFHVYPILDRETVPFLRMCAGRVIDGVNLLRAETPIPGSVSNTEAATKAFNEVVLCYANRFRANSPQDAPAWQADRLAYQLDLFAPDPQHEPDGILRLRAQPERDGSFDWYSFDLDTEPGPSITNPGKAVTKTSYLKPQRITFRSMPNTRWWEFENNLIDIGAIQPEKRDLLRMLLMDFMMVAGNDWFVIPYTLPVGSLCWIDLLAVHDVFGIATRIKPAIPQANTPDGERWTMFTHTIAGDSTQLAPFFFLPPTASNVRQEGAPIEEVQFLRDEMANLVWAIEEITENGVGLRWPGREADLATKLALPPPTTTDASAPTLRYQAQSPIPLHWFPFIATDFSSEEQGRFQLEFAQLLGARKKLPRGRLLNPKAVNGSYRIWEEEVPSEGVRILRTPARSRWLDGNTYLWTMRQKSPVSEHSTIALRFDQAVSSA